MASNDIGKDKDDDDNDDVRLSVPGKPNNKAILTNET